MRRLHVFNVALLSLLIAGSWLAWPSLPDQLPAHLDAAGNVTRWTARTAGSWFLLPGLAVALTGLQYLIAYLTPRWPALISIPDKERFLALPAEGRLPVIERVQELMLGISAVVTLMLGLVQAGLYRAAHGRTGPGVMIAILVLGVLLVPVTFGVWMPRIQDEVDRQVERRGPVRRMHRPEPGA